MNIVFVLGAGAANGTTEIIEHRRMEPVFYITDDPEVRRKLGVPD